MESSPRLSPPKNLRAQQRKPVRNAKGDFVRNFPTFLVAQEWREWAMTELEPLDGTASAPRGLWRDLSA